MLLAPWLLVVAAAPLRAEPRVTVERRAVDAAAPFQFERVPRPSRTDAANEATFTIARGQADPNSGGLGTLNEGRVPAQADEPDANFFFVGGAEGGRLLVDLGRVVDIRQVNTYSWHPAERGPQVYKLYVPDSPTRPFDPRSAAAEELEAAGWRRLATVDTREGAAGGGQYGVRVDDSNEGLLAQARQLLFVIEPTGLDRRFGNTFFSELDVVDGVEHPLPASGLDVLRLPQGYEITFDTTEAPELRPWVEQRLKPVCAEWYPRIVALLPSEGFEAPREFSITFHREMRGVAHASGRRIHCAVPWFRRNLEGEALGAVVHEMVHIVQQYGRAPNPGWLVEGLADYIRWFLYEPAESRPRIGPNANHTDGYRTTAALLDHVVASHGAGAVTKLNAAMRQGKYRDELWAELTGKSVEQLWTDLIQASRDPR